MYSFADAAATCGTPGRVLAQRPVELLVQPLARHLERPPAARAQVPAPPRARRCEPHRRPRARRLLALPRLLGGVPSSGPGSQPGKSPVSTTAGGSPGSYPGAPSGGSGPGVLAPVFYPGSSPGGGGTTTGGGGTTRRRYHRGGGATTGGAGWPRAAQVCGGRAGEHRNHGRSGWRRMLLRYLHCGHRLARLHHGDDRHHCDHCHRLTRRSEGLDAVQPDISVVIPAHNERSRIASTIHSIARARTSGARVELVVVDDASTDGTVANLVSALPRLLDEPESISASSPSTINPATITPATAVPRSRPRLSSS